MPKPNQDLPGDKPPPEPYTEPGESKAGRGGIVSPGGTQPKPKEDPRKDAGLEPEEPEATPKKK
jgi:hypothetical protein